jgi:DtxR family Mn-dependent transcriptional regulator
MARVTAVPELDSTSESEQMYLITVAQAVEEGAVGPIAISRIADELRVSIPSANEMVKKLANRDLVTYEPYHGVELTPAGNLLADQVLRTRRLWATFLAEHLGFSPVDADAQACHLEHATSAEAADRLAAFLGNPEAGPLGHPIPEATSTPRRRPSVTLREIPVGETVEVISVAATGPTLEFLLSEGIKVGITLTVVATGSTGLLLELGSDAVHVSEHLAGVIEVRSTGGSDAPA